MALDRVWCIGRQDILREIWHSSKPGTLGSYFWCHGAVVSRPPHGVVVFLKLPKYKVLATVVVFDVKEVMNAQAGLLLECNAAA